LERHLNFQNRTELIANKKKKRIENFVRQIIKEKLLQQFWSPEAKQILAQNIEKIFKKDTSPYAVSEELLKFFSTQIED
jgi:putative protein kinase ArgK-like GTPase of G3E family